MKADFTARTTPKTKDSMGKVLSKTNPYGQHLRNADIVLQGVKMKIDSLLE